MFVGQVDRRDIRDASVGARWNMMLLSLFGTSISSNSRSLSHAIIVPCVTVIHVSPIPKVIVKYPYPSTTTGDTMSSDPHNHTPEEEKAARVIQRTYRSHQARTKVKGMKMYVNDPHVWFEKRCPSPSRLLAESPGSGVESHLSMSRSDPMHAKRKPLQRELWVPIIHGSSRRASRSFAALIIGNPKHDGTTWSNVPATRPTPPSSWRIRTMSHRAGLGPCTLRPGYRLVMGSTPPPTLVSKATKTKIRAQAV